MGRRCCIALFTADNNDPLSLQIKQARTSAGDIFLVLGYYSNMCGQVLERSHSNAGETPTIAEYVGAGPGFDEAIAQYANSYADQVEQDCGAFQSAIRLGRLQIGSMPATIEQVII